MSNPTIKQILLDILNASRLSKPFLTIKEVSLYTGLTVGYIYKLCSTRQIPYYKCPTGKVLIFKRSEIDSWLTQCKVDVLKS